MIECEPIEYGGYLFTCDKESNHCLYRTNMRTKDRIMISRGTCRGFVIDNGRIYFASYDGIYGVFFSKLETQIVTSDNAAYLVFSERYIFYSNLSAGGAIYRVKPNGSDCTIVTQDSGCYLSIYSGKLFYSDSADGFSLKSVSLDGSQKAEFGLRGCHYVRACRGFLVYSHDESNGAMYKMDIRTKETMRLNDEPSVIVGVRDGYVLYKTSELGTLHRIRLDGRG